MIRRRRGHQMEAATAFDVCDTIQSWLSRFEHDRRHGAPSTCAALVADHGLWTTDELRRIATHLNGIADGRDALARGKAERESSAARPQPASAG